MFWDIAVGVAVDVSAGVNVVVTAGVSRERCTLFFFLTEYRGSAHGLGVSNVIGKRT